MLSVKNKSGLLTIIQYTCLALILFLNKWLVENRILLMVQVLGFIIGFWAILAMSKGKLNIAPNIREGAILIQSGPYQLVRHPMYLALLLTLLPMLSENHQGVNLMVYVVFCINLIVKLLFEESLLRNEFSEYEAYMKKTFRLLPYLF